MLVFGTRPEAIKMAPLVKGLQARPDQFETVVCVTAQHREMLDQVLKLFEIVPEHDLNVMKPGQDLFDITANILTGLKPVLAGERPDWVLVHGDTTTTLAASLAAFYSQIRWAMSKPACAPATSARRFPKRSTAASPAASPICILRPPRWPRPTCCAKAWTRHHVVVTGNTVIDALLAVVHKLRNDPAAQRELRCAVRLSGSMPSA